MQLHEILRVSEINSVAILRYMASVCARTKYHCAGELGPVRIDSAAWGREPGSARSLPTNLQYSKV